MAQPSQNPKLTFFEVVFQGKPKVVRAFLSGLLMGSGREATVFFHFDEGVRHDGKAERLAALVGVRATNCQVIVDADTSAYLKKLAPRIAAETGLQIESHRSIRSASLEFSYRAFLPVRRRSPRPAQGTAGRPDPQGIQARRADRPQGQGRGSLLARPRFRGLRRGHCHRRHRAAHPIPPADGGLSAGQDGGNRPEARLNRS